jgi:glycosyltransferase involved in cell wall biosynthesis
MSGRNHVSPEPRTVVVVPCFNDGATLRGALDSLRDQEPHELVVIDDGSDDSVTLDVLRELEAAGVRMLHQANTGLAGARMAGVEATRARYVMPLDADDELLPGALTLLADALDAHPEAAVAWGDVEIFGSISLEVETAHDLDPWLITYVSEIPGTSMVRRDALLAAGGWHFQSEYEDWDLWMTLAECGWRGVRVPAVTLRYRRGSDRMNADGIARHGAIHTELARRHAELFADRGRNWRRSTAPLHTRMLVPLVAAIPGLKPYDRYRLVRFVGRPRQILRSRRARREAGETVDLRLSRT